ncbi:hypothetical protein EI555_000468, partial [Monodon monoceros]
DLTMSLYCGITHRRKSFWCYRLLSTYVTKTRWKASWKPEMETELKGSFVGLRKALFQLNVKNASLLSTAQALLHWHDAHQFCSRSRQPTKKNVAGSKRVCPSNKIIYYPQMTPVVITPVAIRREAAEEVGLEVERLQYSASQHWPFPNGAFMIACHATVKPGQTEIQVNLRELEAAAWFSHDEVATTLRKDNPYYQQQNGAFPFWLPHHHHHHPS